MTSWGGIITPSVVIHRRKLPQNKLVNIYMKTVKVWYDAWQGHKPVDRKKG